MKITTTGIDLAKEAFQIHGVDIQGKVVLSPTSCAMFEHGKVCTVYRDQPNCDVSALHCKSLVYGGVQTIFLFPIVHSHIHDHMVGVLSLHESRSQKHQGTVGKLPRKLSDTTES